MSTSASTALPEPLTPSDCDLRDFPFMALDVQRLLTSETWIEAAATPHLSHALISLWAASWHERPAASLPANPAVLARLSMLEARAWAKVKDRVFSVWIACADGRLYHPVVAEKALEAWIEKLSQRLSSGAGNAARWGIAFDPGEIEQAISAAADMLRKIAPQSRALPKAIRKRSRRDATASGSGSQGTETGTGITERDSTRGVGSFGEGSSHARTHEGAREAEPPDDDAPCPTDEVA